MRKLKIIEHISLDGVIQAAGGPNEDPPYPYGGWAGPHADPDGGAAIVAAHGDAFDLLLGRRLTLRMELRHANSRSSAQRLCPRASSSVPTSRTVLCAPAPTPTRGRKPTSEIMRRKPGTEGRFPGSFGLRSAVFSRGARGIEIRIVRLGCRFFLCATTIG